MWTQEQIARLERAAQDIALAAGEMNPGPTQMAEPRAPAPSRTDALDVDAERLTAVVKDIERAVVEGFENARGRYENFIRAYRADGLPVAALSVCGKGTEEKRFTELLRYYLDPSEPHGLGGLLLETGFQHYAPFQVDWSRAVVDSEYVLGDAAKVDLLIRAPNLVVAVEQKLLSREDSRGGTRQLERYSKALREHCPDLPDHRIIRIFLTRRGALPSDEHWLPLTHARLVRDLSRTLGRKDLTPVAHHNLRCLLWDLATGESARERGKWRALAKRLEEALMDTASAIKTMGWISGAVPEFELLLDVLEAKA